MTKKATNNRCSYVFVIDSDLAIKHTIINTEMQIYYIFSNTIGISL
ncbi:8709_t:CDS:2 [Cetraspora pellucida]|uniref:8709_t:CDS:1 n=1 Tax=Cetraspora pellucida TaxID=1433469 RepID=A0A9N9GIC3_9GLOM|nr:8709_t:CDS:2 [Cetraspora pellucida]